LALLTCWRGALRRGVITSERVHLPGWGAHDVDKEHCIPTLCGLPFHSSIVRISHQRSYCGLPCHSSIGRISHERSYCGLPCHSSIGRISHEPTSSTKLSQVENNFLNSRADSKDAKSHIFICRRSFPSYTRIVISLIPKLS
jgi:hypothetical protein